MKKKLCAVLLALLMLLSLTLAACGDKQVCTTHDYDSESGRCKICGVLCKHEEYDENHVCNICGMQVRHKYDKGVCTGCGYKHTDHEFIGKDLLCKVCKYECPHDLNENSVCVLCGGDFNGEFDVGNVEVQPESVLTGLNVFYLGSSVTYGSASQRFSFVEYMAKRNNQTYVKEAVSGTLLRNRDDSSYVKRIENFDVNASPDLFVCQLSTNDVSDIAQLGEISDSKDKADFDVLTITGAIEYIIAYAKDTWNCPVVFYTVTYYDSEAYASMVERLLEIQKKWDIGVIDMWHDEGMLAVSEEDYDRYMNDRVHPTKEGYLMWWTPFMENYLKEYLTK